MPLTTTLKITFYVGKLMKLKSEWIQKQKKNISSYNEHLLSFEHIHLNILKQKYNVDCKNTSVQKTLKFDLKLLNDIRRGIKKHFLQLDLIFFEFFEQRCAFCLTFSKELTKLTGTKFLQCLEQGFPNGAILVKRGGGNIKICGDKLLRPQGEGGKSLFFTKINFGFYLKALKANYKLVFIEFKNII